jgi:hypothetical protein
MANGFLARYSSVLPPGGGGGGVAGAAHPAHPATQPPKPKPNPCVNADATGAPAARVNWSKPGETQACV